MIQHMKLTVDRRARSFQFRYRPPDVLVCHVLARIAITVDGDHAVMAGTGQSQRMKVHHVVGYQHPLRRLRQCEYFRIQTSIPVQFRDADTS